MQNGDSFAGARLVAGSLALIVISFAACSGSGSSNAGAGGDVSAGSGSPNGGDVAAITAGVDSGGQPETGGSQSETGGSPSAGQPDTGAGGAMGGAGLQSGAGGAQSESGGASSCDPACTATLGSNNCPGGQAYWNCGPAHPFSGAPVPCTTLPTPQPTYCCPTSYLAECY